MTTPLVDNKGPLSVDGTTTTATFELPLFHGGTKLHFGNISGLTGTLSASWDGTTFTNIPSILHDGTLVAAGGTVTAADDAELFFHAIGATHVRFTRAAGSGPVKLVSTFAADGHLAALLRGMAGGTANVSVTPPAIQCYSFIADGSDELLVSASARKLWGVDVFSLDATPVYVKLYDKATAPSESDTPIHRTGVPANATATNGAGNNKGVWPAYIALTNGLGVRAVSGIADNNDGTLTGSEVIVNVYWSV